VICRRFYNRIPRRLDATEKGARAAVRLSISYGEVRGRASWVLEEREGQVETRDMMMWRAELRE
jgi:hypothetical protein